MRRRGWEGVHVLPYFLVQNCNSLPTTTSQSPALPGPPSPSPHIYVLPPSFDPLTVMPYENSPLLPKSTSTTNCVEYGLPMKTETSIYDRFTPQRKRMILVLISLAGMIPCELVFLVPCRVHVN